MDALGAARTVASALHGAGFQAWLVGGCVRDRLLALPLKDADLATDARPEQVASLFPKTQFVGARFGVSIVPVGEERLEVATFRRDGPYTNHRHPEFVDFGTIEQDAARRDFTVNALFEHPFTGEIRDYHGGLKDLREKRLRAVGDPHQRFEEDALRILRAIRFSARLGFAIEPTTWRAMVDRAHTLLHLSPERHREELTTMLLSPAAPRAIALLDEAGILPLLLPEVAALKGVEQGREFHPEGDAYVHTLLVVEKVEPRTLRSVWSALLHDIGKAPTFRRDPVTRRISFHEHQHVGAEMAEKILSRLRFSLADSAAIVSATARHMAFLDVQRMSRGTLRRFLGHPEIELDLTLHRADALGSNGWLGAYDFCRAQLEQYASEPVVPKPLLRGSELMELGVPEGPEVGKMLREMQELQLEGMLVDRHGALAFVRQKLDASGS
jgi:poly(A) polymerase